MSKQVEDLTAMALIGDGIVGLMRPQAHCLHWRVGPKALRKFIDVFIAHPHLTRALAAIEAGFGVWLAARGRE